MRGVVGTPFDRLQTMLGPDGRCPVAQASAWVSVGFGR